MIKTVDLIDSKSRLPWPVLDNIACILHNLFQVCSEVIFCRAFISFHVLTGLVFFRDAALKADDGFKRRMFVVMVRFNFNHTDIMVDFYCIVIVNLYSAPRNATLIRVAPISRYAEKIRLSKGFRETPVLSHEQIMGESRFLGEGYPTCIRFCSIYYLRMY